MLFRSTHTHTYTYTCSHTHIHTHTHTHAHTRTHTRSHTQLRDASFRRQFLVQCASLLHCTHARTNTHTHTLTHTRTHMHTHVHTRTHMQTHAHTHTRSHIQLRDASFRRQFLVQCASLLHCTQKPGKLAEKVASSSSSFEGAQDLSNKVAYFTMLL